MKINNWLIGSDIEMFIQNQDTGKLMSAAGDASNGYQALVPGSKRNPYYLDGKGGYAVERDNVSVEFLIPPTVSVDSFIDSINFMKNYIKSTLYAGYVPIAMSSAIFDDDQLEAEGAKEFGCDRDMNAWTSRYNPKPPKGGNLRSNGFHIHIGYSNPTTKMSIELIKAMDYFVGLSSLEYDLDVDRRTLYGSAGSYRIKPYGVEYRSVSGALIASDEAIRSVFHNTLKAIDFINSGNRLNNIIGQRVVKAINTCNADLAQELLLTTIVKQKAV